MKVVAIIQARMGSSRLPGKILKPLVDKKVLDHVIQRVLKVPSIHSVVIATTTEPEDDIIVEQSKINGVHCYRGSKENVLSRYYNAAKEYDADVIVRITSDCPLIDPIITENVIQHFFDTEADYTSNKTTPTFPRGLDTEVFSMRALETCFEKAYNNIHTEHVTPYIYLHKEDFVISEYTWPKNYANYRWTLDTSEDYELITKMYEVLYKKDEIFDWLKGIALMEENPELVKINNEIRQKELGE